jgi:hypothetical protein
MSLQGEWICYLPRAFARGRDYQVFSGARALSAQLTDAFTVESEGMLRAQGLPEQPTWRYVPLPSDPFMALCRCTGAQQAGAQALVVWGLLLPHDYVRSSRFSLGPLMARFPGAELAPELPAALDLTHIEPPARPGAGLDALLSHYLDAGRVKVNLDPSRALSLFTRIVEALAPRDRLEVSFATTPGSERSLAVDAAAPPPEDVPASVDGLARLGLWRLARGELTDPEVQDASLRERSAGWLGALLRKQELRAGYGKLMRAMRVQLAASLHEVASGYLRRALEIRLLELPPAEAARALSSLVEDRLLTGEAGVPPMWLPRIALQATCLRHLSPPLLERILQADVLPMILESVQRPSSLERLKDLVHALALAPRPRDPERLRQGCLSVIREILKQGVGDHTLGKAVAVLELHAYSGSGPDARAPELARQM